MTGAHDHGSMSKELPWPPAADVHRLMAGELSLASRLGHTALLLAALAGASVAAALLVTEVDLPVRTRIALTALILIGLSWTAFATWVLTRRRVLFAAHRIVAARMAVVFSAAFALGALALGQWGSTGRTWFAAAGTGAVMCGVAAGMLMRARRRYDDLWRRRRELESQLGARGTMNGILLIALLASAPFPALAQHPVRPAVELTAGTYVVSGMDLAAEEGRLVVAANRASASAGTLTLRFMRLRSSAASPGSPIVFLAGGPGDSGIRAVAGMPMPLLKQLLAIADVIALDQRGTGRSEPLNPRCPPGEILPRDRPADPAAQLAGLRQRVAECLSAATKAGLDVGGLTTAESADDLEDLRRAIDAPKLSLLAGSYGTHLALAAARRHPDLVDRMVLAGVEGPDDTIKLPGRVDEVLSRIAAGKRPTLLEEVSRLRRQLASTPARFVFPAGQTIVLGEWDLQRFVAESLGTVREIDAMLTAIPAMIEGDFSTLARWALQSRLPRPLNLMNLAMDCASYGSPERLDRIAREAPSAVLGDAINFPLPGVCDVDGLPRLPPAFRAPAMSDAPTLLIAGTFDGRTPVQNARDAARSLPNARTLVIDGASHGLMGDPQVMRETVAFLRGAPR